MMSDVKTTKKVAATAPKSAGIAPRAEITHLYFGRINDEDAAAGITRCLGAGITSCSRYGLSIHAREKSTAIHPIIAHGLTSHAHIVPSIKPTVLISIYYL